MKTNLCDPTKVGVEYGFGRDKAEKGESGDHNCRDVACNVSINTPIMTFYININDIEP